MSKVILGNWSHSRARRAAALAIAVLVAIATVAVSAFPARAADGARINLRVLLVTNGDSQTQALGVEMDRLGIPYTSVDLRAGSRPTIDQAFLQDTSNNTAKFQAIILPNQAGGGLSDQEMSAVATYESGFGVRQINGYDWPSATMGLPAGGAAGGAMDGVLATVTPSGLAGPFSYLNGPVTFDQGSWGAVSTTPDATYTSLIDATLNGVTGTIMGVNAVSGREQLVSLVNFNEHQQWSNAVMPGMLSWVTRGVFLGYQRNYFNVHIDDVLMPDSRWSIEHKCTPGDSCVDPSITTPDIRMTSGDVTRLTTWQADNNLKLSMVFNGYGSENAGGNSDPLTTSLLAVQEQFPWINHTWQHWYLGCIQIAPVVGSPAGATWHCATSPTETPRMDEDINPHAMSGGTDWAAAGAIRSQVETNIDWARTRGLTHFDPTELVTGEHSGLTSLPQMPVDNPFLGPELQALGIRVTGSDASREPTTRAISGSSVMTMPRYPMNIFYNAGTFQEEVAEYNWIYTSAADGGSDICTQNPATTTCITPLDASSEAAATASFDSYIKPIEIRNAMRKVMTNDTRPFYAHQSNLAEDGILYPVLDGVVDTYSSLYNLATTPLVQNSLTQEYQALAQMDAWNTTKNGVDAYIDGSGVHLPSSATSVPLTVPSGSTAGGLSSYAGALSGWVEGGSTASVPPTGYVFASTALAPPTIGAATAGNAQATVNWTAPSSDGGSPITGYTLRVYADGVLTTTTATAAADATSVTITGLTPATPYTFDVAAVNASGVGTYSAISDPAVVPTTLPEAPTAVTAEPGSTNATVAWTAPSSDGGSAISGYTVRGYRSGASTPTVTADVATNATTMVVSGLTNGDQWAFDVAAINSNGTGRFSAQSAPVTPNDGLVPRPSNVVGQAGNGSATVTWSPPSSPEEVTGYRVRAFAGSGTAAARTTTVPATSLSASMTGLANGTAYTFDVAAVASADAGPTSTRSDVVTPALNQQSDGAPSITSVTPGTSSLVVAWNPPIDTSGRTPSGYRIRVFSGATGTSAVRTSTATGTATTATVTGLTNGTNYSVEVNVQYGGTNGATSARSAVAAPVATAPGAPTIGTAGSGAQGGAVTATARWSPPASTGGAAINGYIVTATSTTTSVTSTSPVLGSGSRSYQMSLPAGTYTFSVVARNAVGTSVPSAQSNVVTAR